MPRNGKTTFEPNQEWFDTILRTTGVEKLVDTTAQRALAAAQASAPVQTQAYKNGLHIEHHDSRFRRAARVVGSDDKTLLIESKKGVLARALKAAKR